MKPNKITSVTLILDADTQDAFTKDATGCITKGFKIGTVYNLYVEITLSVCTDLCLHLHDHTCTLIIFIPKARSCILLPWYNITIVDNSEDCELVELHHRHRQQGKSLYRFKWRELKIPRTSIHLNPILSDYIHPSKKINARHM